MKNPVTLLFLSILFSGCTFSVTPANEQKLPESTAGTKEEQKGAVEAARGYLAQIDRGDYEATWDSAGPVLRDMTNEFMWTNTLKIARKTVVVLPGRKLEGGAFTTQIDPGGPAGEYAVMQFVGRSGKLTATEKVVMQKEQGKWKIVGYFITKRAEYKSGS
jgi:hypothetical protein